MTTSSESRLALFHAGDSFSLEKLVFLPEQPCAEPMPLLCQSTATEHEIGVHDARERQVSSLGVYLMKNVRIIDGVNYAGPDQVLVDRDLTPIYWRRMIANGITGNMDEVASRPVRVVDGPVLSVASLGYAAYGHWWLDIIPRLYLFYRIFGGLQWIERVLMPFDTPDYGMDLLAYYGVTESKLEWIRPREETILARTLLVPSLIHDSYTFHSAFLDFIEDAKRRIMSPTPELSPKKIFVSRRNYLKRSAGEHRTLVNEPELRAIAEARGYETIFPEELTWARKLEVFSGARIMVGEFGSSLHHSMFAAPGARIGAIGIMNNTQSTLGSICRHRNLYITPQEVHDGGVRRMRVDVGAFTTALDALEDQYV